PYQLQPIFRLGDTVGGVRLTGHVDIGALNDRGQIAFITENPNGDESLVQYSDGKLTPLVVGGAAGPFGTWGTDNGVEGPISMNQRGDIVFATDLVTGRDVDVSTFLWDFTQQKITPVLRKGMPAVNNLTFETGGDATPAINNAGEIALVAALKNAAGRA